MATTGTVKFYNEARGYGFISPDGGGADAYVSQAEIDNAGMQTLKENQRVSYELEPDSKGKMAAAKLRVAE